MTNSKNTSILLVVLLAGFVLQGCATKAQQPVQSAKEIQTATGIIPCDTDADCFAKNGELADDYAKSSVHLCDSIAKSGKACKRHVREAGLMCWQHSREFNNPATRSAFLARQGVK